MPITYAAIARRSTVLCEYFASTGNAPQVTRKILEKLPEGDHRKSYKFGNVIFHYHADAAGLVVLVMSDDIDDGGTRIAFSCIADIRNQFMGTCGNLWVTAGELELNGAFARVLRDKLDFYSHNQGADKLRDARGKVDDLRDLMKANMGKVIDRGDRIDSLVERTQDLEAQAGEFKQTSGDLRRQLWWENKKYWLICALISAIIIGVIVLIIVLVVTKG
jgi:vesicle-associated membrane protein 7